MTIMKGLKVELAGGSFVHVIYHYLLIKKYSNF